MPLEDKIGRAEIVNNVCGLVHSLKKDENFCLAINGTWGSGKSFVLGLIEEKLRQVPEYVVIKYDAWENSFYSDPLISILSCVLDGIEGKYNSLKATKDELINVASAGVNALAKLSPKIAAIEAAINGIKAVIKHFRAPINAEALDDFKSYQKLLKETKEALCKITQAEETSERQTKLVILVDEIDRCLPSDQLKILERLHHLFDVKNCAVIITMNQDCVAKTIKTMYGTDGYEYLRKFFNFSFRLTASSDGYLKNLLDGYTESCAKFNVPVSEVEMIVTIAYECLLYGRKHPLDKTDNRELTRYIDGVMNVCNDFGWERLSQKYIFFILIALYIRKNISPSFLNKDVIVANQERALKAAQRGTMPYHDYLKEFLGIDRDNPPENFSQFNKWNGTSYFSELSWCFNETIAYSLPGQVFYGFDMRRFFNQPTVTPNECIKLRKLIILYGGEQQTRENT
ncbi:MAG: P-loop NTPase fold protein [Mollicutes bacterium]|nr:P-loop NTPase fold protein [Mollicutes bacterium]